MGYLTAPSDSNGVYLGMCWADAGTQPVLTSSSVTVRKVCSWDGLLSYTKGAQFDSPNVMQGQHALPLDGVINSVPSGHYINVEIWNVDSCVNFKLLTNTTILIQ